MGFHAEVNRHVTSGVPRPWVFENHGVRWFSASLTD
uniref:Uncharacterized protein n=1 Tax=Anguilla anguilla TaxID=7936 RepID=A0A0E9XCA7_ANGAN